MEVEDISTKLSATQQPLIFSEDRQHHIMSVYEKYMAEVKMPPIGNCKIYRINSALMRLPYRKIGAELVVGPPEDYRWYRKSLEDILNIKDIGETSKLEPHKQEQLSVRRNEFRTKVSFTKGKNAKDSIRQKEIAYLRTEQENTRGHFSEIKDSIAVVPGSNKEATLKGTLEESRESTSYWKDKENCKDVSQKYFEREMQDENHDSKQKLKTKVKHEPSSSSENSSEFLLTTNLKAMKQATDDIEYIKRTYFMNVSPQEALSDRKCTHTTEESNQLRQTAGSNMNDTGWTRKEETGQNEIMNEHCEDIDKMPYMLTPGKALIGNQQTIISQIANKETGSSEENYSDIVTQKQKEPIPETLSQFKLIPLHKNSDMHKMNEQLTLTLKLKSALDERKDPFSKSFPCVTPASKNCNENQNSKISKSHKSKENFTSAQNDLRYVNDLHKKVSKSDHKHKSTENEVRQTKAYETICQTQSTKENSIDGFSQESQEICVPYTKKEQKIRAESSSYEAVMKNKCNTLLEYPEPLEENSSTKKNEPVLSEPTSNVISQGEREKSFKIGNKTGIINTKEDKAMQYVNEAITQDSDFESMYISSEESHNDKTTITINNCREHKIYENFREKIQPEILNDTSSERRNHEIPLLSTLNETELERTFEKNDTNIEHGNSNIPLLSATINEAKLNETFDTNEELINGAESNDYVFVDTHSLASEKPLHLDSKLFSGVRSLTSSFFSTLSKTIQQRSGEGIKCKRQETKSLKWKPEHGQQDEEFVEISAGILSAANVIKSNKSLTENEISLKVNMDETEIEKKHGSDIESPRKKVSDENEISSKSSDVLTTHTAMQASVLHPKPVEKYDDYKEHCNHKNTNETKEGEQISSSPNGNKRSCSDNQWHMENQRRDEEYIKPASQQNNNINKKNKSNASKKKLEIWTPVETNITTALSSKEVPRNDIKRTSEKSETTFSTELKESENAAQQEARKETHKKCTNDYMTSVDLFSSLVEEIAPPTDCPDAIKVLIIHTEEDTRIASELAEKLRNKFQFRAIITSSLSPLEAMSPYSYINGAMHWADIVMPLVTNKWLDEVSNISTSPRRKRSSLMVRRSYMLIQNRVMSGINAHWHVIPVVKAGTDHKYRSWPEFFNAIPIWKQFSKLERTIKEVHKLQRLRS